MPFPNFHSARVKSPGSFTPGSFRTITLPKSKGIKAVIGRLKGKTTTTVQAYRFPITAYTVAQAKAWLKEHNVKPILFEPAKKDDFGDDGFEFEEITADEALLETLGLREDAKWDHIAVIRPRDDFVGGSFEYETIDDSRGVWEIKGTLADGSVGMKEVQRYEFSPRQFTVNQVKKWLDDRGIEFKKIVPAEEKEKLDSDGISQTAESRADLMMLPEGDFDFMRERFQRTDEGYLKGRAILTNVGVFTYLLPGGSRRRELRPPEEVFASDSVQSLRMIPLTNQHPKEKVDSENIKKVQAGYGGDDVRQDSYHLSAPLVITDPATVEGIERGNKAISCGYMVDVEEKGGVWMGVPYDAIQRNIRYNHVAVNLEHGRAGDDAVIKLDGVDSFDAYCMDVQEYTKPNSREDSMGNLKKVTLDGVEYEAEAQVLEALHNTQGDLKTKTDELKTKTDELEALKTDKAKADGERDSLKEENEQLKKDKTEAEKVQPGKIKEAVDARIDLVTHAAKAGAEVKAEMTDMEIKKAVILKAFPKADEKLKDAADAYIDARYDAAVEYLEDHQGDENRQIVSDAVPGNGRGDAPDAGKSYVAMVERMTNAYKGDKQES
jgi:hypothetical protein